MLKQILIVRRHPYEEPHHTELEIIASDGEFAGRVRFFTSVETITDLAKGLIAFCDDPNSEFIYRSDGRGSAFRMTCRSSNKTGNCALEIDMRADAARPFEGSCLLTLHSDIGAIVKLGARLREFSRLSYEELHWLPNGDGRMFEKHQKE
ncbi:hypothetical protein M2360_002529 [Rhizobium sp. SG_E_25_P2]|uniref:hypothetical protein n=1 Tax=Rhizobium sp. SG_E_25_P2 TaxID=2879942 RepID=UPI002473D815|nr:hypothetical protein [Rhizobium sp. SG_E_25_P2]MDH6267132.1 hypothetical protein [Rhizobium sp. SG_E_25_P2]